MKINKESVAHYKWGLNCDGWRFLNRDNLSIIHEKMPPGTYEEKHFHQISWQFFYILIGQATIELNGERYELNPFEGIEIPPETPHQIFNKSDESIEFLVISQPTTLGDRIAVTD
ncbi:cupin domain-containing protein [Paenibacillus sp. GSMTC-2017]|uniref:cupin domain-containing protein n=1 Tax=Paenibacillus sp. GSMTC-2017 TaxID=2794350 RepID=UPI0018D81A86|nr:cupin domain-containing protein [Paenibacillus sp. GSMTC-2017]MBH5317676.1 cupin domain-containing protein [Paenibacillus sp. GSMTC-2017]